MEKGKGLIITFLTILIIAFIVFVAIMQHNFNNPEFTQTYTGTAQESIPEEDTVEDSKDESNSATDKENSAENKQDDEAETEEAEITHSTKYVNVEILNVRSGPGIDYDIEGVVGINDELAVEDSGDDWVKITADDFEGYVNEKYLSDEPSE